METHPTTTTSILLLILLTTLLAPTSHATDTTPPTILATTQSATTIHPGDTITLCAQARDNTALSWAYLQTNETGTWQTTQPWWNSHWTRRISITVDHTKVAGPLADFPLLVKITNADFTQYAQPNGADFAFTDPSNTIQYPHEIDTYDTNASTLIAWVKIPQLSAIQDTRLNLYFGNPTCPNQERPNETWSDYLSVFHFSHSLICNSYNGSRIISPQLYSVIYYPGRIGSYISFWDKRSSSWKIFDSGFRLQADSSYTISAWILPLTLNSYNGSLQMAILQGNNSGGLSIATNKTGQISAIAKTTSGSSCCYSRTNLSYDKWSSFYDRIDTQTKNHDLFINGVKEANKPIIGNVLPETQGLLIGWNWTRYYFMGCLDELRVCARAINDPWIKTENTMMAFPDSFISFSNAYSQNLSIIINPIKLLELPHSQWANFSWSNPQVLPGTTIGWRIVFQDTNGNQNETPIAGFSVIGSVPPLPQGPTSAPAESLVTFSIQRIRSEDVLYQMDYDDDGLPDWTSFTSAGVQNVTHSWLHPGVYFVRVRTQTAPGDISSWSPPATIMITDKILLSLSIPTAVAEGDVFNVTVTAGSRPVAGVTVRFMGVLHITDASGVVSFTAPSVSRSENYPLSSFSPGYRVNNETIIVTPMGSEEGFGWIYGSVQDTSGKSLRDVQLSTTASGGGMSRCVFSDDSGGYTLAVPPGTYTLVAGKVGFQAVVESSVMVHAGEAVGLSLNLSSTDTGGNLSGDQDVMEALIDAGVVAQKIVGRLDVDAGGQYAFTSYDESLSGSMLFMAQGSVVFSVSHRNASGAVVAVRLADGAGGGDVGVLVDGHAVPRVGVGEVMSADSGSAEYARVVDVVGGRSVAYCLVYLPHFSSYTVEIRSVVGGLVWEGLAVYVGVAVVVAVLVVVPLVAVERRRR